MGFTFFYREKKGGDASIFWLVVSWVDLFSSFSIDGLLSDLNLNSSSVFSLASVSRSDLNANPFVVDLNEFRI